MQIRLSLLEIFLLQTVVWLALWLISDYIAGLLTIIIGAIVSAVLLLALISEAIERSRVPRSYFLVMAISVLALLVAAGIYIAFSGGQFDFLDR